MLPCHPPLLHGHLGSKCCVSGARVLDLVGSRDEPRRGVTRASSNRAKTSTLFSVFDPVRSGQRHTLTHYLFGTLIAERLSVGRTCCDLGLSSRVPLPRAVALPWHDELVGVQWCHLELTRS